MFSLCTMTKGEIVRIAIVVMALLLLLAACGAPAPGPGPQPILGPTPTTGPTPIPPSTQLLLEVPLGRRLVLSYSDKQYTFSLGSEVTDGIRYRISGREGVIGAGEQKGDLGFVSQTCGPVTPCQVTITIGDKKFTGRVQFPEGRNPPGEPHLYVYAP